MRARYVRAVGGGRGVGRRPAWWGAAARRREGRPSALLPGCAPPGLLSRLRRGARPRLIGILAPPPAVSISPPFYGRPGAIAFSAARATAARGYRCD